jgi:hypothetical protein
MRSENNRAKNKDIEFLREYCTSHMDKKDEKLSKKINITKDCKHHFTYDLLSDISSKYMMNNLTNNSTNNLTDKIIIEPDDYEYSLKFKNAENKILNIKKEKNKISKNKKMIRDVNNICYKMPSTSESIDFIEQIPMIKLFMITYSVCKHINFKIDLTDRKDPRILFKFFFYDKKTATYNKVVYVSINDKVLVGSDSLPILASIKSKNEIKKDMTIFYLLIKTFLFMINIFGIDIEKSNINSFIASARGGRIYTLGNPNNYNYAELDPEDFYIMMVNLLESNMLVGVTPGNTFLYILKSIIKDDNDVDKYVFNFLNPIRGNTISVCADELMIGMKRACIILDRTVLSEIL